MWWIWTANILPSVEFVQTIIESVGRLLGSDSMIFMTFVVFVLANGFICVSLYFLFKLRCMPSFFFLIVICLALWAYEFRIGWYCIDIYMGNDGFFNFILKCVLWLSIFAIIGFAYLFPLGKMQSELCPMCRRDECRICLSTTYGNNYTKKENYRSELGDLIKTKTTTTLYSDGHSTSHTDRIYEKHHYHDNVTYRNIYKTYKCIYCEYIWKENDGREEIDRETVYTGTSETSR